MSVASSPAVRQRHQTTGGPGELRFLPRLPSKTCSGSATAGLGSTHGLGLSTRPREMPVSAKTRPSWSQTGPIIPGQLLQRVLGLSARISLDILHQLAASAGRAIFAGRPTALFLKTSIHGASQPPSSSSTCPARGCRPRNDPRAGQRWRE